MNENVKEFYENSLKNKTFLKIETKIKNQYNQNKIYYGIVTKVYDSGFLISNTEKDVCAYLEFNTVLAVNQIKEKVNEGKKNGNQNDFSNLE